jgi:hypothetical protein
MGKNNHDHRGGQAVAKIGYEAGRIKRQRRTNDQIAMLDAALAAILEEIRPATVRQLFYQAVTRGLIEKTEPAYDTIGRRLVAMRRGGIVPFHWITDYSRWMRKPDSYTGIGAMLADTAQVYRRDIWRSQEAYCEIWLEKECLSGVLYDVTEEFDVPLMCCKGYPSLSFLHGAAQTIAKKKKPIYLYYAGDHDPSGVNISVKVEQAIREFAPDADLHFERVAVTPAQINEFDLPTRPTKKSDSRSKSFEGESVEVDALPPDTLRQIIRDCIERHIEPTTLATVRKAEQSERAYLHKLSQTIGGAA